MSTFHGRNRKYRGDNQRFIQFCVKLSPLELLVPINSFFYPDAEGEISKWGCSTTAISRSADVETAVLHVGVFDKMVNWKGFFFILDLLCLSWHLWLFNYGALCLVKFWIQKQIHLLTLKTTLKLFSLLKKRGICDWKTFISKIK